MRRSRGRTRAGQWKRAVDWDAATWVTVLNDGDFACDWIRPPTDTLAPLSYDFIVPAKTLVRLLANPSGQVSSILANGTFDFAWGVIVLTSDGTSAPPATFPNPYDGAFDWVMYHRLTVTNRTGFPAFYQALNYGGDVGNWLESKAMRRLPPNTGLALCCAFDATNAASLGLNIPFRMALKGDVSAAGLGGN